MESKKNKKIVKLKLKYTYADHEKIKKNFEYPILSFLNGLGKWTFTDGDFSYDTGLICNKMQEPNENEKKLYCYLGKKKTICSNNGIDCTGKNTIEPKKLLDISTWNKVYFYQEGYNDYEEWIMICKNDDGVYIYFKASCDYTGFDCQGGGDIIYCKDKKIFWDYCLDCYARQLLLAKNGITFKIKMP